MIFFCCVCYPFFLNVPFCRFSTSYLSLLKIFFCMFAFQRVPPTSAMCLCRGLAFQREVPRHLHNQTSSGTSGFSPREQIVVTSALHPVPPFLGETNWPLCDWKSSGCLKSPEEDGKSFHRTLRRGRALPVAVSSVCAPLIAVWGSLGLVSVDFSVVGVFNCAMCIWRNTMKSWFQMF